MSTRSLCLFASDMYRSKHPVYTGHSDLIRRSVRTYLRSSAWCFFGGILVLLRVRSCQPNAHSGLADLIGFAAFLSRSGTFALFSTLSVSIIIAIILFLNLFWLIVTHLILRPDYIYKKIQKKTPENWRFFVFFGNWADAGFLSRLIPLRSQCFPAFSNSRETFST